MSEHVSDLTRALVQAVLGRVTDNKVSTDLHRYCMNILDSTEPSKSDDAIAKIEKHLAVKRGVKVAAEFSKTYAQLSRKESLERPASVAEFMHRVALNNDRAHYFGGGVRLSSTPIHAQLSAVQTPASLRDMTRHTHRNETFNSSSISTLYSGLRDVTSLPPSGRQYTTESSGFASGDGRSLVSQSRTLTAPISTQLNVKSAKSTHRQLFKDDVQEIELVREVLLVAQGINGKLARFDVKADGYRLPENVRVPSCKRNACNKLFEAGWLYNHIKQFLDSKKSDTIFGPVGQSFCVAVQHELTTYHRLLAVLDAQVTASQSDTSKGLTLPRLLVWFHDPMYNLKLLAALVDIVKGKKGGALLSAVHSYIWHGDPRHTDLISHILGVTVKPLFEVINRWIYTGHLDDPYSEFFVAADPGVRDEGLWHFKYTLRKAMIPSFISTEMAQKIMLTGKSVQFIHRVCHDNTELQLREVISNARIQDPTAMFVQESQDGFQRMVDVAYKEISRHLMEVLHEKYNFINNLKAMRRYLLLGQGDFIQQLMDLLVDELSKDASSLYMHNLNGILETAIRATNAQFDDKDILTRLDVRLLEISPGDLGWDVFSLDYRTKGPIQTVFTQDTMIFYLRIFNFLWRAKRMEYALANLWRQKQQHSRLLRDMVEIDDMLHASHIVAAEMIHFTQQIGYYINFEVLECSWDELLRKVDKADDLDHIIAAHQEFLDRIITRCLMDEDHREVFSQLRTIFDLIIRYQLLLENFFEAASREKTLRDDFEARKKTRSDKSQWAVTEDDEQGEKQRKQTFIQDTVKPARNQLKVLAKTYQDMVTKFLVMLATQTDYDLQGLRFRLDFNEHYQAKEPILCSPQILKKCQPRRPIGASEVGKSLIGVLGGRVSDRDSGTAA